VVRKCQGAGKYHTEAHGGRRSRVGRFRTDEQRAWGGHPPDKDRSLATGNTGQERAASGSGQSRFSREVKENAASTSRKSDKVCLKPNWMEQAGSGEDAQDQFQDTLLQDATLGSKWIRKRDKSKRL